MESTNPRDAFRAFTTTVALITTDGPMGPNVMAAEWTFNVSYDPFLISVHVARENATHAAIEATKEFGVNLVTDEQVAAMAFAGHFSKADTDKLASTLFETYPATKIKPPMIKGALLNAECRLVQQVDFGDHTAFVGEVVAFALDPTKSPVVLHHGAHRLGDRLLRDPGIVVAATPMHAQAGETLSVSGELMGPDRGSKPLDILLLSDSGNELSRGNTISNGGYFEARLRLPNPMPRGTYRVLVRTGSLQGEAHLQIE